MTEADIVKEAVAAVERSVLASIVHVEGHAYRKKGATMLLHGSGASSGTLSPGCLEADLAGHVPAVLGEGAPRLIDYDMRSPDDLLWGEAIGCGGYIRILLEPVAGKLLAVLKEAANCLDRGEAVRFIRVFDEQLLPVAYVLEKPGGKLAARTISGDAAAAGAQPRSMELLLEPKPRLVLFGAGDDAKPVHKLAQQAGFRVVCADFRAAMCTAERFPGAELACGDPKVLAAELRVTGGDYIVVMSHQFKRDYEFVQAVMEAKPAYLGIMGSAARTKRMLEGKDIPGWLHYPVGLAIGADGPDEIAVSIVAELIACRRGRWKDGAASHRRALLGRRRKQSDGPGEAVRYGR